jgi:hypothetical protein
LRAAVWFVLALLLSLAWVAPEPSQARVVLGGLGFAAEAVLEDRKRHPRARPSCALSLAGLKTTVPRSKPRALASGGTPDVILALSRQVETVRFGETRAPTDRSAPRSTLLRAFRARAPPSSVIA